MKAIWRLALRDLRFNKVRALFGALLIALPVTGALAFGTMFSSADTHWLLDELANVEDLQGAATVNCACEIRQLPKANGEMHTDTLREDGDAVEMVSARISPRNSVELVESPSFLWIRKSAAYNLVYIEAVNAAPNESLIIEGTLPTKKGDIALSRSMSESLGVGVGDTVFQNSDVDEDIPVTLTGITERTNLVAHGGDFERPTLDDLVKNYGGPIQLVITGPDPVTWEQMKDLNRIGVFVASVDVFANPPSDEESEEWFGFYEEWMFNSSNTVAITTVLLIGLIEVVLLVSPPFTMAVRRNERSLGQLAALGATTRQLRSLMLYQGFILGLAGAVIGIIGSFLFRLLVTLTTGDTLPITWWHLPAITLVALVLGLIAALLPAITASRINVVAVLTGREAGQSVRHKARLTGPAILLVGLVVLLIAQPHHPDIVLSAGLIITVLGLIFTAPLCVRLAAKVISTVSLPGKLAGRESIRSVYRTAPGVAAVMIVTIVATFAIAHFTTLMSKSFSEENIAGPRGAIWTYMSTSGAGGDDDQILADAVAEFDKQRAVKSWTPVYVAGAGLHHVELVTPEDEQCPYDDWGYLGMLSQDQINHVYDMAQTDPRCEHHWENVRPAVSTLPHYFESGYALVDDGTLLTLLPQVTNIDQAQGILSRGGMILNSDRPITNGEATAQTVIYNETGAEVLESVSSPAEAFIDPSGPDIVLSRELAEQLGLTIYPVGALIVFEDPVSLVETASVERMHSGNGELYVAFVNEVNSDYAVLAFIASVLTILVAVGTASIIVILAGRETRGDFDTIDALGGKPSLRRRVSVALTSVITLAGVIPGLVLGALLLTPLGELLTGQALEVPYLYLLALGAFIFLSTSLVGGLAAPRRRSLTRRTD